MNPPVIFDALLFHHGEHSVDSAILSLLAGGNPRQGSVETLTSSLKVAIRLQTLDLVRAERLGMG